MGVRDLVQLVHITLLKVKLNLYRFAMKQPETILLEILLECLETIEPSKKDEIRNAFSVDQGLNRNRRQSVFGVWVVFVKKTSMQLKSRAVVVWLFFLKFSIDCRRQFRLAPNSDNFRFHFSNCGRRHGIPASVRVSKRIGKNSIVIIESFLISEIFALAGMDH